VRARLGVSPGHLVGLGVDRLDYTKGIVERLLAVERLFELHPEWIGRFTFVQIAAPSRSSLDEYQRFEAQVRATAAQINVRFGTGAYEPVRMLIEHHGSASVAEHYRAADVCVVTSLHDGMNLVAKEYVAARDDERGVLILSQFAGAARELHEALIVNPYHVEEVAEAMHRALSMPADEQRERMASLRQLVREFNVYRWAGRMLMEAAQLRQRERISARIGVTKGVN
jgi:trehalose 6-phosphate synthase